jgi:hypothetical protein
MTRLSQKGQPLLYGFAECFSLYHFGVPNMALVIKEIAS